MLFPDVYNGKQSIELHVLVALPLLSKYVIGRTGHTYLRTDNYLYWLTVVDDPLIDLRQVFLASLLTLDAIVRADKMLSLRTVIHRRAVVPRALSCHFLCHRVCIFLLVSCWLIHGLFRNKSRRGEVRT